MTSILVVEDDDAIRTGLVRGLGARGLAVASVGAGLPALEVGVKDRPDVVLLDLGLPDVDGLRVLAMIRAVSQVPVIVVTAQDDDRMVVAALDAGADDYVVKPFSPRELAARVAAVLRRVEESSGVKDQKTLTFDGLRIDPNTREVLVRGEPATLTAREFDLLHHLASTPGRVYTRDQLMEGVWGYSFSADTSTVTVHVRRLREKVESIPAKPRYLQTVWGVGYKFGE